MKAGYKVLFVFLFFLFISFSFSLDIAGVKQKVYDSYLLKTSGFEGYDDEIILSGNSFVKIGESGYWVVSVISLTSSYADYIVIDDKKPDTLVTDNYYENVIKSKIFVDYLGGKELYYSSTLTNYFLNLSTELETMNYNLDMFVNSLTDENVTQSSILKNVSDAKVEISAIKQSATNAKDNSQKLENNLIDLKKEIPGSINEEMNANASNLSIFTTEIVSEYSSLDSELKSLKNSVVDLNIDVSKKQILLGLLEFSPQLQTISSKKEVIDSSYSNVQKAYNSSVSKNLIENLTYNWDQRKIRALIFQAYFLENKEIKNKTKKSTLDSLVSEIISTKSLWNNPESTTLESKKQDFYAKIKAGKYSEAKDLLDILQEKALAIYANGKKEVVVDDTADSTSQTWYYVLYVLIGVFVLIIAYKIFKKYASKENPEGEEDSKEEEFKL
ncbi:MAG: hypothetical protein PHH82_03840 [Candidatus ainarchaeum sp.]|nr:hypothetical protein [Candidatus ainarchaeum sp.]